MRWDTMPVDPNPTRERAAHAVVRGVPRSRVGLGFGEM